MIALPTPIPLHFKEIDRGKAYARRDPIGRAVREETWETTRIDTIQVNPVTEAPRIVMPSFFAPITRWGVRQINRTKMQARPRFQERFVLVGHLIKQVQDRRRMQGVEGRAAGGAYVYVYPQFYTGQRAVVLGPPVATSRR